MSTTPAKIKLRSSDGRDFEVDAAVAAESQTIKHMLDDGFSDDVIPLPEIPGKILAKVIEYCKKHVEPPHFHEKDLQAWNNELIKDPRSHEELLEAWDADFVNVHENTLLILAANFLNIKSLFELASQTLMITNVEKTREETRIMTLEEEEMVIEKALE